MFNNKIHEKYLKLAQEKSKKIFGYNLPNPSVCCLIVDYTNNRLGKIIGSGITGKNGRPHAEEIAIKKINKNIDNLIMYVTLEPCFHYSENQSCVDQIIKSGIRKIFIAAKDPDKRTNNKSIKKLKKNNIFVNVGITSKLFYLLNRFFYINKSQNRSYIKYKLAVSKDYKISYCNKKNKWISNHKSRNYAHLLRFQSDAILTTADTINSDNSRLTIRLYNYPQFKNKIIILDSNLKLKMSSTILHSSKKRNIIIFTSSKNYKKINELKKINCDIIYQKKINNYLDIKKILKKTYSLNITNILVEAGRKLFKEMYDKKLIDEFHLFVSSKNIGKQGLNICSKNKIFPLKKLKSRLITKKKFLNDNYYHFNF